MIVIWFGFVVCFNVLMKIYYVIKYFVVMIVFYGGVFFCFEMNFFVFFIVFIVVKFFFINIIGKWFFVCVNFFVFFLVVNFNNKKNIVFEII